ncbi:pentapeptide repeat-containing protein [Iningainema tapete]|uniref:Pentapeptide repeat-containing protein n=1 Tax=Iningainema tapete BLCC-T55 TaxID=2748662 RepID=A0A8J7BX92_9CYAN|nr:pentapeptide repeat-containing protein [Iningainema tapete]MBD2772503.1 pentapeptide repeat-containing protein [Iningainema tapete BLCC-T55]
MYKLYNIRLYRKQISDKIPTAHQLEALETLHEWFNEQRDVHSGSILVLPTGGGKTFTTIRFLCTSPLSRGYKVLWLAHTHHLLEQAFHTFESEVKHISLPKTRLDVRVVSGTPGHCSVEEIELRDDVLIATLQTLTRAYKRKQPKLEAFLKSANDKLFVVFDEAHHSPSPTYRQLILAMQQRFPKMYLLGLTATPTYTYKCRFGWLEKLFPQRIIYQVTAQRLMADGILSKPEIEQHQTNFEVPEFEEDEYKKWIKSYQDLPEDIISQLAENRDRNAFIAETYATNKERYGKTIMFADRWFQCEQLREFLENRGIRAGVVYSGVKSSEKERIRNRNENARVLDAFRRNELDVLINIKMLTEGTDVPDVQTVFITRETKSEILLTQMVGRALRGPRMGGTEKAYIVAFIDIWQYEIKWAGYAQILPGLAYDDASENNPTSPCIILADLVRRLAQQMDRSIDTITGPFLTLLPLGWYKVEFETVIEGSEDDRIMAELVMVFEGEKEAYERFIEKIASNHSQDFVEIDIQFDDKYQIIRELCIETFYDQDITAEVIGEWTNENLLRNLFHIARHVSQNEGEKPPFFFFEERKNHDLDELAQKFVNDDLGPRALEQALQVEFTRKDRYWKTIYYSYELFKQHYNACVDKLLVKEQYNISYNGYFLPSENSNQPANYQRVEINNEEQKPKEIVPEMKKDKSFSDLSIPKQIGSLEQWKDFVCESIKLFYGCDIVQSFKVLGSGRHTSWVIHLDTGTDADLIKPYLEMLMQKIQTVLESVRYVPPEMICVDHVSVERKNHYGRQIEGVRTKPLRSAQTEWILKIAVENKIVVISGPFKDFEGEVMEVSIEHSKLKAILSIFGHNTPVELEFNQVQRVAKPSANKLDEDNSNSVTFNRVNVQEANTGTGETISFVTNDNQNEDVDAIDLVVSSKAGEKSKEARLDEIQNRMIAKELLTRYAAGERIFHGVNLSGTNLSETNLSKATLWKANLNGANLSRANLKLASLYQASLEKAELRESDLSKANLREANLTGANLQKANLSKANLMRASFQDADLRGANLREANLTGANLDGANLQEANLIATIMPDGTISNQTESSEPPTILSLEQTGQNLDTIITDFIRTLRYPTRSFIKICKVEFFKSLDGNYDLLIICPSQKVQKSLETQMVTLTSKFQRYFGSFSKIFLCTKRDLIPLNNLNDLAVNMSEWFLKEVLQSKSFKNQLKAYACLQHKSHNWYMIVTKETIYNMRRI